MGIKGCATGIALTAVVAFLTACHAPPPRPAPSPQAPAQAPAPAASPARPGLPARGPAPTANFRIDSARSELRVFVYRAGPMAALGHNHVIANRALQGWVRYAGALEDAAFELRVPCAGFSVDEPALRSAAGKDFSEAVDDEARRGTLDNMLGASVLDAAVHPTILVRSLELAGTPPHLNASVSIELAGHASRHLVPFDLVATSDLLHARGVLELKQSSLGLTPFSIFLGALRVEDTMRLEFDLNAVR